MEAKTEYAFVTANINNRISIFSNPDFAQIIFDTIIFGKNKEWYRLYAFVVMPDHIHLLIGTTGKKSISQIMHSIKSYSAHKIDKILTTHGQIWQHRNYVTMLDDKKFIIMRIKYIENNPVRAGLADTPEDYYFSSAAHRDLMNYEDW